jgi:hypothetical protein
LFIGRPGSVVQTFSIYRCVVGTCRMLWHQMAELPAPETAGICRIALKWQNALPLRPQVADSQRLHVFALQCSQVRLCARVSESIYCVAKDWPDRMVIKRSCRSCSKCCMCCVG